MFQPLWPDLPVWEVPITPITNGVHLPTWLNGDLAMLYDQYLQPDWREQYHERGVWDHIDDIPNRELWEAHRRRKRKLITFVRERMMPARNPPARLGSGGQAPQRGAGSRRVHHRLRAPLRHL